MPDRLKRAFQPIFSPVLTITPLETDVSVPPQASVIFSSVNGVKFAPPGNRRTAYCIGPATTQAAKSAGWHAQEKGDTADALVQSLADSGLSFDQLIHLSGRHTRGQVAKRLNALGVPVDHHVIYDQRLQPLSTEALSALAGNRPVFIPLFSPRTARHLANEISNATFVTFIALSRNVAVEVRILGETSVFVADEPNAASLMSEIETALKSARMG